MGQRSRRRVEGLFARATNMGSQAMVLSKYTWGPVRGRGASLSSMLAAVSVVALSASAALAGDETAKRSGEDSPAVKALMAKLQSMEQRINDLQGELKAAKSGKSKTADIGQSASLASRRLTDA